MTFVLDCSVTMAWCFKDEASAYSDQILELLNKSEGLVPDLWLLEVCNVLVLAEKHSRIKVADSIRFMELLLNLPLNIEEALNFNQALSILNISRQYHLTSYDATYLELALRKGIPLATQDHALRKASQKSGVSPHFSSK